MSTVRIQHASVPRPAGDEAVNQAIQFYSGVLECPEIPKPRTFGAIDVTWFRCGEDEIHLLAVGPDDPRPHSGAHFCIAVDDLSAVRRRLEEAGCTVEEAAPIPGRPRFYTLDPFGNLIEITTIEGDYRESR